jgi:hypothetical protein
LRIEHQISPFYRIRGQTTALCIFRSGWPDWANFRSLDNCFLWAVFWKLQKKPNCLIL